MVSNVNKYMKIFHHNLVTTAIWDIRGKIIKHSTSSKEFEDFANQPPLFSRTPNSNILSYLRAKIVAKDACFVITCNAVLVASYMLNSHFDISRLLVIPNAFGTAFEFFFSPLFIKEQDSLQLQFAVSCVPCRKGIGYGVPNFVHELPFVFAL